jgi:predicted ATPase
LAVSPQLKHQVEAWLGEISPGTRIYTVPHVNLDLVNLEYAFASSLGETNHFRATNVGFGITYTLPILVAILSSAPGTLILLENPEAHLHPRGQTKMGELFALAAASGLQILVETHSDHLLNGVRLAVHSGQIPPNKVVLHYFTRGGDAAKVGTTIKSPKIDRAGRLDFWPQGFFDESEKILRKLLAPPES